MQTHINLHTHTNIFSGLQYPFSSLSKSIKIRGRDKEGGAREMEEERRASRVASVCIHIPRHGVVVKTRAPGIICSGC
jgi:hypothetical protein